MIINDASGFVICVVLGVTGVVVGGVNAGLPVCAVPSCTCMRPCAMRDGTQVVRARAYGNMDNYLRFSAKIQPSKFVVDVGQCMTETKLDHFQLIRITQFPRGTLKKFFNTLITFICV